MACFSERLNSAVTVASKEKWGALIGALFLGLGVPACVSVAAALAISQDEWFPEGSHFPKELFLVTIIKIVSIITLSYHTQASVTEMLEEKAATHERYNSSTAFYRYVATYMALAAIVLSVYACLLIFRPQDVVIHSKVTDSLIAVGLSLYMFIFLIGNIRFYRNNKGNIGVECFTKAFIFGTNVPFILAFILILFTFWILPMKLPSDNYPAETFFAGAVAFLIYSSTAASICIDYFARPFLSAGKINYPDGCPILALPKAINDGSMSPGDR